MLGIPAGIQNAIFAIANLFVQTGVNSFDTVMVSGSTAATNADTLIFNVMYAFYTGCSSFMSQNYGARNKKRVLKSYFISLFYSFTTGLILGLLLFILVISSCLCSPQTQLLLMPACRELRSWPFHIVCPLLWTAQLQHPAVLEKPSFLRSLSFWDPVFSVLSGSTPFLPGFIQFRHYSFCISSHGSSHLSQKSFIS